MANNRTGMSFYVNEAKKLGQLSGPNELFSLDWSEFKELHEEGIRAAFKEMMPKIALLKKLAEDVGISEIKDLDDVVPLLFPHTMFKSYPLSFIENRKFDKLTQWLQKLTTLDLSAVDTSGCDTLDDWVERIEKATPMRPYITSGTSGKVSVVPISTFESPGPGFRYLRMSFRDEPGMETIEAFENVPYICPSPRNGKASPMRSMDAIRDFIYNGREQMIVSLGGQVSIDIMWLSGRIRAAEAKGELDQLKLTPGLQELREKIMKSRLNEPKRFDAYWEEVINTYRGKRVIFFNAWQRWLELADFLERTGLKLEFAPNSLFMCGGGKKGFVLPDGWEEKLAKYIPLPICEFYGMTEMVGGVGRKCSHGHYHLPQWIVPFILDPDTLEALPRSGRQTGRFAFFDLTAETYWGGFTTGDKVTFDWEGGCPCGRKGPFLDGNVTRYSEEKGDDKISCQKQPFLYNEAQDFLINL